MHCKIGETLLYGNKVGFVTFEDTKKLDFDLNNELHILRHFSEVSDSYKNSLLGKKVLVDNQLQVINSELLDTYMLTKGSKFFSTVPGFEDPKRVLQFVHKATTEYCTKNKILWIEDSYGINAYFTLSLEHPIGTMGIIPKTHIDPEVEVIKINRGSLGKDMIEVYGVNIEPPKTGLLTVILKRFHSKTSIFSVYPGIITPHLPHKSMELEEFSLSSSFWENYYFCI